MIELAASWRRLGVRWRLTLVYFMILVALLGGLGTYFYSGAASSLESGLLRQVRTSTEAVVAALDDGPLDAARVEEVAERNARFGETIAVVHRSGGLVAISGPPPAPGDWSLPAAPVRELTLSGFMEADGRRVAWGARSLHEHTDHSVFVFAGTGSIEGTLAEIPIALAASLVVAAAVGGLLIWWATGRELAPVRRLATASRQMAGGDASVRVQEESGRDELADVTHAFNAMVQQVSDSLERQRRFVSDASHELRTPLTALRGELDMLDRADASAAAELRAAMHAQLARLSRLVDDLLTLARLDALGPEALELRECDIGRIAQDVVEQVRHLPTAADRTIRLVAGEAAPVRGDPDALHRLLLNLVANGARHAGQGGVVTVTVRSGVAAVTCEVRDSGPGIPASDLDSIFDRFRRLRPGSDDAPPDGGHEPDRGAGLGLAIVRSIVETHGGRVAVRNDHGAVFTVTIPRWLADNQSG